MKDGNKSRTRHIQIILIDFTVGLLVVMLHNDKCPRYIDKARLSRWIFISDDGIILMNNENVICDVCPSFQSL